MKRFPALFLILFLLAGCAAHSLPSDPLAQPEINSEAPGLYDPDSQLEASTKGAVRCFPLDGIACTGMLAIQEGILLFETREAATTLTTLSWEGTVKARLELPFPLNSQDASLQPGADGFSCFDPLHQETIVIDSNLQIISRFPAPEDLTGKALLSQDGETLYYCTASAIRSLELGSGISRILKESAYPGQSVDGLLMDDRVLVCRMMENGKSSALLLNAETGTTLAVSSKIQSITGCNAHYYATMQEGCNTPLVFGQTEEAVQTLLIPDAGTEQYILPDTHSVLAAKPDTGGKVQLDYYDLHSGKRTASLSLPPEAAPDGVASRQDGSVWFWNQMSNTLYCWNTGLSPMVDDRVYTEQYFTRSSPDAGAIDACIQSAQALGEEYGIEVLVYQDAVSVQPEDGKLTYEHLANVLDWELHKLEQSLSNYPPGFLQTIAQRFEGLTICIVRDFSTTTTLDTNAFQFWDGHHACIALAAGRDTERGLYHTLCHLIDTIVLGLSSAYDTWDQHNPTGFTYDYDYTANQNRNSTAYLLDNSRYFIDMYSMSFPKEDRARIMEYAMTPGNENLFQTEAMQGKLYTLCTGIREAFELENWPKQLLWEQYLHKSLIP